MNFRGGCERETRFSCFYGSVEAFVDNPIHCFTINFVVHHVIAERPQACEVFEFPVAKMHLVRDVVKSLCRHVDPPTLPVKDVSGTWKLQDILQVDVVNSLKDDIRS